MKTHNVVTSRNDVRRTCKPWCCPMPHRPQKHEKWGQVTWKLESAQGPVISPVNADIRQVRQARQTPTKITTNQLPNDTRDTPVLCKNTFRQALLVHNSAHINVLGLFFSFMLRIRVVRPRRSVSFFTRESRPLRDVGAVESCLNSSWNGLLTDWSWGLFTVFWK